MENFRTDIEMPKGMDDTILELYTNIKEIWMNNASEIDKQDEQKDTHILSTFLLSITETLLFKKMVILPDVFVALLKCYEAEMQQSIKFLEHHEDSVKKAFIRDFCELMKRSLNELKTLDTFQEKSRIILN